MSRIAFCWELGRGLGHIARHLPLIRQLVARGDEVVFCARDKIRVAELLRGSPVQVIEIEAGFTAPAERIRGADSYCEILYNCGFHDANTLRRRVQRLAAQIDDIAPDILVVDFAPSVVVANRGLARPLVAAGDGFVVPVRALPMPRFRYWQGTIGAASLQIEERVLGTINRALTQLGWPQVDSVATLLGADAEWLMTFAELDFYGERNDASYLGSFPVAEFGDVPIWPSADAAKVFAYLRPGPTAAAALRACEKLGLSVCLYAPEMSVADKQSLDKRFIGIVEAPVDVRAAGAEATLFVSNGNLNTVTASLLAGKAQLALPTSAERYVNARRLELLGAGLAAPQVRPGNIEAKLRGLLANREYTRAAARFARKHAGASLTKQTNTMLGDIDRLR